MTVNESLIFDTTYFVIKMKNLKFVSTQFHLLFINVIKEKVWTKLNNKFKETKNVTNKEQKSFHIVLT